jgi:hypothetical protein
LIVSNNNCHTNWQNKCHNKTAVNCPHQAYEWAWIWSGSNQRASHTYHSTIFSSFSESAEVSKISRRVRWALWYLIKTSLFCTYFRTKSCENKNAYNNVCQMHTTQYIYAKNQKIGTLLTTMFKSLNYNEVQTQIKQTNKEENVNNDTFYLAKFSGCWTWHDRTK